MPLGTQPPALWAREGSRGLLLLKQTFSRYSFLDPSVCLLYPKEQKIMIELKWDLLAAKSLAADSSKAACFNNPSMRVQEVGGEVHWLLFVEARLIISLSSLSLPPGNFHALIFVRESEVG